jgi:hypothetical protein
MGTVTKGRATTDLADEPENDASGQGEEQQQHRGLIDRVKDDLQKRRDRKPTTLADGTTVSAETGKFLREHPSARFLGAEVLMWAAESGGPGRERRVRWNPRAHTIAQRHLCLREYIELPGGTEVQKRSATETDSRQPPRPEIWMVEDQKEPILIGFTMSKAALERIGALPEKAEGNEDAQQPQ